MVDPKNHENVIYLLIDKNHVQQIITSDGHYSIDTTSTVPPLDDIQQDQELPPNLPQLQPLPAVQELTCDPTLDVIRNLGHDLEGETTEHLLHIDSVYTIALWCPHQRLS